MTPHTYLEHGLSVLHARLRTPRASTNPAARVDVHPFITLSRETGAGATTVGQELVPLLDRAVADDGPRWVLLDRDLLDQALKHHRLPATLAEYLPEDRISEIRATIGELVGLHPSLWQLEQKVAEAVLQLAHVGHVILAGRAAHLITRSLSGGLHVRLVASRDVRIGRVAAEMHCSRATAAEHVDKNDDARRRFVRANFDADLDDPHAYDLVVNTDHLSARATAELIVTALKRHTHEPSALSVRPTLTA
jgi:cytidylate kinase